MSEMATWYCVRNGPGSTDTTIEPVDVVRETEKTLVALNSRGREERFSKITEWYAHFPSEDEAAAYIAERLRSQIRSLVARLEEARNCYADLQSRFPAVIPNPVDSEAE